MQGCDSEGVPVSGVVMLRIKRVAFSNGFDLELRLTS